MAEDNYLAIRGKMQLVIKNLEDIFPIAGSEHQYAIIVEVGKLLQEVLKVDDMVLVFQEVGH